MLGPNLTNVERRLAELREAVQAQNRIQQSGINELKDLATVLIAVENQLDCICKALTKLATKPATNLYFRLGQPTKQ